MTDLYETELTITAPAIEAPSAIAPRASWSSEARALMVLATPLVLTQLAQMAIGTTDLLLLGRYSEAALAAAAMGNTIFFFAWMVGGGPAAAVSPMIAQLIGARPRTRGGVRASLRMGLWSVIITWALMAPVMLSAGPLLTLIGEDPELAKMAGRFTSILVLGLPFSLGYLVLRNFATALGRPAASLWVMVATIAVNALAGWTLIFGHFGAPRLGIVGSAIATASSALFSFVAMVGVIQFDPKLRVYRMFRRFNRPVGVKLAEVFRLGLPIGMTMIFEGMLFNTMTLLMGRFGTTALAAHQIAINPPSITFMVPLGIGMAACVRVGVAVGAGDMAAARRAGQTAFAISIIFGLICAAILAAFSPQIAGLYLGGRSARDTAVISLAALFLKGAAAFQVVDAVQVVGAQSLRGLKDARTPMLLAGGSYWLIGAPVCLFLALGLHLQGLGIWIGFVVSLTAAAIAMSVRFWRLTHPRNGV
ncbi:MAG TPA: MATE family efflux transporter [Caulobacteraceae bacterium]|nr:MATE family efflux transporter [Caulobacteraceae bacterium]